MCKKQGTPKQTANGKQVTRRRRKLAPMPPTWAGRRWKPYKGPSIFELLGVPEGTLF